MVLNPNSVGTFIGIIRRRADSRSVKTVFRPCKRIGIAAALPGKVSNLSSLLLAYCPVSVYFADTFRVKNALVKLNYIVRKTWINTPITVRIRVRRIVP